MRVQREGLEIQKRSSVADGGGCHRAGRVGQELIEGRPQAGSRVPATPGLRGENRGAGGGRRGVLELRVIPAPGMTFWSNRR